MSKAEELANKKYVKDLSNPARYVISKVIIEILSNSAWQIPLQPLFNQINANKDLIQKIKTNQL